MHCVLPNIMLKCLLNGSYTGMQWRPTGCLWTKHKQKTRTKFSKEFGPHWNFSKGTAVMTFDCHVCARNKNYASEENTAKMHSLQFSIKVLRDEFRINFTLHLAFKMVHFTDLIMTDVSWHIQKPMWHEHERDKFLA